MNFRHPIARVLSSFILFVTTGTVLAHKPSDSYLSLKVDGSQVCGQWDLALRDLEVAIRLDANDDGNITWGELRAQHAAIAAYVRARLRISSDGKWASLRITRQAVDQHADGGYAVVNFAVDGLGAPAQIQVDYQALFDLDPSHRGLFRLEARNQTRQAVFAPGTERQQFDLAVPQPLREFLSFGREGIWHIWVGFDHLLFLVALLLPAVLWQQGREWAPVGEFRPALMNVVKVVTAFSLAHSLTLSLATLGVVSLPTRWVESAIAASVVLAAANNLWPVVGDRGWMVAFGFGLVHGFGFANVLAELGLRHGALARALVAFNLGVEAGQLAIVAAFFPLAFLLRGTWFYRVLTLRFGSAGIVLLASGWMLERLLNLKWMPF